MNAQTATTPPPRRRRGRSCKTVEQVRAGLTSVINGLWAAADRDEAGVVVLEPKRANALTVAYGALASVLKQGELEDRLAKLEAIATRRFQ